MTITSTKPQRSRRCKPTRSLFKCNNDHMASLSLAIAGCQKVADSSNVPGLSLLFFIAKGIVDTVQGARNNVADAARLAERVCKLVEAISEQSQSRHPPALPARSYPTLEENLRVFRGTLEQIQLLLPEITERSKFMAALHVLQDRQSLQNIGAELNHAMTLFQVCNVRSLQENIRDLQYDMMGLRDDMNNLKDEVKCLRDDTKGMMEKLDNTLRTMNQTLSKIEEQYVKGPTIPAESWTSSLVGKDIAETVKDAQSNVDDAVRLAEKICKQVEGVPASPEQSEPRALPSILGNSIKFPPEGSRRTSDDISPLQPENAGRTTFYVLRDKDNLQDLVKGDTLPQQAVNVNMKMFPNNTNGAVPKPGVSALVRFEEQRWQPLILPVQHRSIIVPSPIPIPPTRILENRRKSHPHILKPTSIVAC